MESISTHERLTDVRELIAGSHGGILPSGVGGGHVAVQHAAYQRFLTRKSDGVKWTPRPMQKLHGCLNLGPALKHGAKTIDDENVFGVQHGDRERIVTRPGIIVNSEECSQIGLRGLRDQV